MIVNDRVTFPNNPNYSIEFGTSTWTENSDPEDQEESVRNRYDSAEGRFSPHGSSEIPMGDIERILCECLKRDKLSTMSIARILHEASLSLQRQILIPD